MGKMGVKIFGPAFLRVTADTARQGFIGQGRAVAPHPFQRAVHAIGVAIFAGGQILGKRFGLLRRSASMDTGLEFLNHVDVGKFLIGRGLFYVAFGGTIYLFDIGVRYLVEADMTIFTLQLAVNGSGKFFIVDIKNPFDPALIISSDAGIAMAQQTIFSVGNGICSKGHTARQQQKKNRKKTGCKGI
jgi:hypothetical protein